MSEDNIAGISLILIFGVPTLIALILLIIDLCKKARKKDNADVKVNDEWTYVKKKSRKKEEQDCGHIVDSYWDID